MAKVSLNGDSINNSTVRNHIYYKKWEYQYTDSYGNAIYDWNPYYADATVKGNVKSSVTNVKINGVSPIVKGDVTTENDTYDLPSGGVYVSGSHTNASGSVNTGNQSNVYVNGKSLAIIGSNVTTHAGTSTTISSVGSSNVYIN